MVGEVTGHLLGPQETAALLGVTRQRLLQLLDAYPDFPKPDAELAIGRVWRRADVERWARKHGRQVTG